MNKNRGNDVERTNETIISRAAYDYVFSVIITKNVMQMTVLGKLSPHYGKTNLNIKLKDVTK